MSPYREALGKFKEIELQFNMHTLPEDIKKALPALISAMDGITRIFLMQQDEKLPKRYTEVMQGTEDERKRFYKQFKGPYNSLEEFHTVEPDFPSRPAGCAFYPDGMTREELEAAIEKLPEAEKTAARDTYTVIRRTAAGALSVIPYTEIYKKELEFIAGKLKEAAAIVTHPGLKHYLAIRAEGLLSNDYRESDAAWVRLTDAPIDFVIGPFEVYADGMLGIKAMYESYLIAVDTEASARLKEIEKNVDKLAALFPVPAGAKPAMGGIAPMVVGSELYASGEASQGIMTSAFNLPNDPWVRGNVGWKQVMLRNVMQAKFASCTSKIAERISGGKIEAAFDPYFYFVLMHEVSHGLGPAYRADGRQVAKCIGKSYTAVEEAKADIGGLFLLLSLAGQYGIPAFEEARLLDSFFAGLFRSMRFGVHEAHGAANVIEFNYLLNKGNIVQTDTGFATNAKGFKEAVVELLDLLCLIEADYSAEQAAGFVAQWAKPGEALLKALDTLKDIPIDIRPVYPI